MVAKLSLASKGVPKLELGNEKKKATRRVAPTVNPDHWLPAPDP